MARTGVTIDSGELPSARGVAEGYQLSNVITRWQHVAAGSFREDCQFLKQIIEETDELRLWEKNVGGFTFKDRDEFLRKKVLIDYELTEADMTEIVSLLKQDDVESVKARLRPKAGRPKKDEENDDVVIIKREELGSNGRRYLIARLRKAKREDLALAVERKEMSARAAAIEAGIIRPPTPLDTLRKVWKRATPSEREAFLKEIA